MNNEIHVPASTSRRGKVLRPEFWVADNISYLISSDHEPHSAAMYQEMKPPTLAEHVHAYFSKTGSGEFLCPEFRKNVRHHKGYGEWTSTFLKNGREMIERPDRVYYDLEINTWVAEGGKTRRIKLPETGWVLEFDKETGFPVRSTLNKADAHKIFGDDASFFNATRLGLAAVIRDYNMQLGPFCVLAHYGPGARVSYVGARSSRQMSLYAHS